MLQQPLEAPQETTFTMIGGFTLLPEHETDLFCPTAAKVLYPLLVFRTHGLNRTAHGTHLFFCLWPEMPGSFRVK